MWRTQGAAVPKGGAFVCVVIQVLVSWTLVVQGFDA
jgi:hypothetical protein